MKHSDALEQFAEQLETGTEPEMEGRSLWQDARRRFFRNKAAVLSLITLTAMLLTILLGPWIAPFSYEDIDWDVLMDIETLGSPSLASGHWFGTDQLGRDIFARTLQGGQISLMVGILGALVAVLIGTIYGAVSGYLGGRTDSVMMRVIEILDSVPFMFMVIMLVTVFGRHIILIFIAIGAVSWLSLARIVRGLTMSLKHKEFIEAAKAGGVKTPAIIRRHIVPNVLGIVMVYSSLLVPALILFESFLSFLGLGVQEPQTSWGALIAEGASNMDVTYWQLVYPAAFLVITLFCFNFIGDGLRDALDPKDR
ncbi:oligopeptide ABC transporter permease OppC [Oceanospirillum sanctuarii]|uniref:oligopeptide ABC transporter permease OppC n=1 Tax=Oceanospirillum sanctuarii TaxID=1434821 RepID=UPI001FE759AA|nr:oligopeptide ABC transporter permease OppC [Oceanospirillum sanctuarii]